MDRRPLVSPGLDLKVSMMRDCLQTPASLHEGVAGDRSRGQWVGKPARLGPNGACLTPSPALSQG
jgi:hypothetical protein